MIGEGQAYGAVTVVNALATGKGAAIGIKLKTKARIKIIDEPIVEGTVLINGEKEKCDLKLVNAARDIIFKKFGIDGGIKFVVESNIPISKGLKSSSAAANALVRAILDAIKEEMDDLSVVKLGVEVAKKAGVTITGAFDDACASMFGGLCITDNIRLELLRREEVTKSKVVIYVPKISVPTASLSKFNFKVLSPRIEKAFKSTLSGMWQKAMITNGLSYASLLGYDIKPIFDALEAGALAAGLSGTGPAIVALAEDPSEIVAAWSRDGDVDILITEVR